MMGKITKLKLKRIEKRVREQHKLPFSYTEDVVKLVVSRCTEVESGGRMVDAILTNTVLPEVSAEFLKRLMRGQSMSRVHVKVENNDFGYEFD
jgi:type VI secretion system protein VasG